MAKLRLPLIKRLGHVRAYRQYLTIQHCTNFCMFSSLHVRVITDQNTIHVLKFFVKSGLSLKICVLKTRHCRRIGILFTSSVIHVPVSFLKQLKQYRMGTIQCGLCKTVVWNSNWMYVPLSIFNLTSIQWWEQFQIHKQARPLKIYEALSLGPATCTYICPYSCSWMSPVLA